MKTTISKKNFDGQKKIRRILAIINKLDENKELSVSKLSEEFGVDKRTIQRDLNFIEMIYNLNREKKGFVSFPEGVGIKRKELNSSQKAALMMVMEVAKNLGGYVENTFLELVKHILGNENFKNFSSEIIPVMPARMSNSQKNSVIDEINEAITFSRVLKIKYLYSDNRIEEKEICPLKILFSEGFLYLLAFPYNKKKEYRTYRIEKIKECEILYEKDFNVPLNLDKIISTASIWGIRTGKKMEIELEIKNWAIDYFKTFKLVNNQKILENPNGTITLKGTIRQFQEILPYILRWMPNVIVRKPKELKDEVKSIITEYLKNCD